MTIHKYPIKTGDLFSFCRQRPNYCSFCLDIPISLRSSGQAPRTKSQGCIKIPKINFASLRKINSCRLRHHSDSIFLLTLCSVNFLNPPKAGRRNFYNAVFLSLPSFLVFLTPISPRFGRDLRFAPTLLIGTGDISPRRIIIRFRVCNNA